MPAKFNNSQIFFVKTILLFIFPVLIYSCNNNPPENRTAFSDSIKSNIKDSLEDERRGPFDFDSYEEKRHLDLKNYFIRILSGHYISDSFYNGALFSQRNLLIVRTKATNLSDTVLMESSDYLDDAVFQELSDSLHIKPLLLQVNWYGDSDIPMSEFLGYWHDSLRTLFTLDNIVSITRKDQWTISGFMRGRDEIIYQPEDDYPYTISLKDFTVESEPPPAQYIGWRTKTLEPVRGYKMITAKDSIRYTIKTGIEVRVDTFYRAAGRVVLILPDSSKFHTNFEEVKLKLESNSAG